MHVELREVDLADRIGGRGVLVSRCNCLYHVRLPYRVCISPVEDGAPTDAQAAVPPLDMSVAIPSAPANRESPAKRGAYSDRTRFRRGPGSELDAPRRLTPASFTALDPRLYRPGSAWASASPAACSIIVCNQRALP